jgi:hypothetical protein
MQLALAERVAAGQSIRLLCHCPPGKRCHLQAVASRVRTLAFSLTSPVPPCSSCDTDDGGDVQRAGVVTAAAPTAEAALDLFGHGGDEPQLHDPQLPQLLWPRPTPPLPPASPQLTPPLPLPPPPQSPPPPSSQPTPLIPSPPITGHGGAPPPWQQLPLAPQLMPAPPPVPLAQPLSAMLAHMASIAAGSTELGPRQRRRSAVHAVRTAAHGTAAQVLGSVRPSTWIALAFVYTLRRQAKESLSAIGRRVLAASRERVLSLRASPPKPITWCDVGVTEELTLIYRDSRGRISAEHPAVAPSDCIRIGAALAIDGSCVVPQLPPQFPPSSSFFELCPDASGAICYLNRDLGIAQWDPPADSTPLQPYAFVDVPAFPLQPPPYPTTSCARRRAGYHRATGCPLGYSAPESPLVPSPVYRLRSSYSRWNAHAAVWKEERHTSWIQAISACRSAQQTRSRTTRQRHIQW